ncbi:hypothetical protein [Microtetraspora sp. NBRC 16547]|uniref:hypothetical protein n=1 Tax=Microtetraspora sp. NBRC 16547 TaxID=3030993 RepID=UPI0024A26FDA|nr:hypothetical protein [Microtetraspora sp. NBRC 16547]GLX02121.1 hypothetical protein Misp02_62070 [Microtetraspora sp. NBRC 16547]
MDGRLGQIRCGCQLADTSEVAGKIAGKIKFVGEFAGVGVVELMAVDVIEDKIASVVEFADKFADMAIVGVSAVMAESEEAGTSKLVGESVDKSAGGDSRLVGVGMGACMVMGTGED